jgi:hypothetical protein
MYVLIIQEASFLRLFPPSFIVEIPSSIIFAFIAGKKNTETNNAGI